MTNKEKYRQLAWENLPIFFQSWWLDIVAPDSWDVVLVENEMQNEVAAVMPYSFRRIGKGIFICMPPLTPFLGPQWKYYSDKYPNRLSSEVNYLSELFSQLPVCIQFEQRWHFSITNWLPLYWSGYQQTTKYHYILTDTQDINFLWSDMKSKMRTQVRKAKKEVEILSDPPVEDIFRLWKKTFEKQDLNPPLPLDRLSKLYKTCIENNCGKTFIAKDNLGNFHSALFIVWDNNSVYSLISASDPAFKSSAITLLFWESFKVASSLKKPYNFCGSVIKPIENYLRDFGGKQTPYFEILKVYSRWFLFRRGASFIMRSIGLKK